MTTAPKSAPKSLGNLLAAIDSQVRIAALRAHCSVVKEMERVESAKVASQEIPPDALLPRDVLATKRIAMKLDVFMRDDRVSLTRGCIGGGTPATIEIEWEAQPAPEATALIRTRAEARIASVEWTAIDPAEKVDPNG